MGQYWRCVNLDKREFIDPYALGNGAKLWEQLASDINAGRMLTILCAAMPEERGGGDFDLGIQDEYTKIAKETIGRWAGNRIAFVGDYAEDTDLPAKFEASKIYDRCTEGKHNEKSYVDITPLVKAVFEHKLKGFFKKSKYGMIYFEYDAERMR
jgi:hypothetical protein